MYLTFTSGGIPTELLLLLFSRVEVGVKTTNRTVQICWPSVSNVRINRSIIKQATKI